MKNKKYIIEIILIIIIIIVIISITIKGNNSNNTIKKNIIHYHENHHLYDITTTKKVIKIVKKEKVQCIKSPCPAIIVKKYSKKYTNKNKKFLKKITKDKENKEITITSVDLNEKEKTIMEDIIK